MDQQVYDNLIRQQEEFLATELALSAINGMSGHVANQLLFQPDLTPERKRELKDQLSLLAREYHLFYSGDKAIMKKALDEYCPRLKALFLAAKAGESLSE
ncbi:MAG: hypothetical protein LBO66_11220 [Deltaproteobacteria bacterium]|jgi:hypothetical protein|nr:hypothetical protein [Deltaproteobacteria bacterium]